MATLTASAVAAGVQPRAVFPGVTSVVSSYNSGSTAFSVSQTTVLMCKIPNKCTITRIFEYHTTGAGTAPADIGIQGVSLSLFAAARAQAVVTNVGGIPYRVSLSDDAIPQYITLTVSPTVGTTTASVKIDLIVDYIMD